MLQESKIRKSLCEVRNLLEDGSLSAQGRIGMRATERALRWALGDLGDLSLTTTAPPYDDDK